jgi:hypothetical protein
MDPKKVRPAFFPTGKNRTDVLLFLPLLQAFEAEITLCNLLIYSKSAEGGGIWAPSFGYRARKPGGEPPGRYIYLLRFRTCPCCVCFVTVIVKYSLYFANF